MTQVWKPKWKKKTEDLINGGEKEELAELRSMFNKFTPQTSERLNPKILKIILTLNEEDVKKAVELFYTSSLANKNYISTFALLARTIIKEEVVAEKRCFLSSLLRKIQKEFNELNELSKDTILLIGELYNAEVLPEKIIKICLKRLNEKMEFYNNPETGTIINSNSDHLAELFTCFIGCIGHKYKVDMSMYIRNLEKYEPKEKRVKYLILDLIDLQKINFQQKDTGPMKIDDIRSK